LALHFHAVSRSWAIPALVVLGLGLLAADRPGGFAPRPDVAGDLPLLVQEDFEHFDRDAWVFTDAEAWRLSDQAGDQRPSPNHVLDQYRASRYEPPVRSPLNLAVARKVDVGDMVLDVQARSTAPDTGRRDLCIVFGYQDPTHFYYAHLGKQADEHHHNLFIVAGKPREAITETRTGGTPWTDGWHHIRLVRHVTDGLIQVFFDDMSRPVLTAHDKTFTHGRIGLGSFDDTGQFDNLQVWGKEERP
jgi:hypothetical protein